MDDAKSVKSGSPAGTLASNGAKRKRVNEVKYYAVRVGYQPGVYHTWADCLDQVKGFKKGTCESSGEAWHRTIADEMKSVKSFSTLTDAERFVAGENPSQNGSNGSPPAAKFYAVKSGRVPGIYTDWPSAQEQITGWQKPKHRCFTTRVEAQMFLDGDEVRATDTTSLVDGDNGASAGGHASEELPEEGSQHIIQRKAQKLGNGCKPIYYNEADFEPGTGPLPPDSEDGFDPNIALDPETGRIVFKTQEQRHAFKSRPSTGAQTEPIRIHTDGSSLGNGQIGAYAGIGVYFGPGDKRYALCAIPITSSTTD